jgi:hypothetical protein
MNFAPAFAFSSACFITWVETTHIQQSYNPCIDESGISMTYATGSSVNAWEGHQSCFETKDMIVLQVSTTLVRVFPKRAFSAEQLTEFRKLLADHGLSPN